MIETGDLRKGTTIEMDGILYQLLEVTHLKLGRGSAQVRMKLRDVRGGAHHRADGAGWLPLYPGRGSSDSPPSTCTTRTTCTTS